MTFVEVKDFLIIKIKNYISFPIIKLKRGIILLVRMFCELNQLKFNFLKKQPLLETTSGKFNNDHTFTKLKHTIIVIV